MELGAYKCHTFLDFRFVEGGEWGMVNEALNGAGVESMQGKWEEMFGIRDEGRKMKDEGEEENAKQKTKKAAVKKPGVKKPAEKKSTSKKTAAKKPSSKAKTTKTPKKSVAKRKEQ